MQTNYQNINDKSIKLSIVQDIPDLETTISFSKVNKYTTPSFSNHLNTTCPSTIASTAPKKEKLEENESLDSKNVALKLDFNATKFEDKPSPNSSLRFINMNNTQNSILSGILNEGRIESSTISSIESIKHPEESTKDSVLSRSNMINLNKEQYKQINDLCSSYYKDTISKSSYFGTIESKFTIKENNLLIHDDTSLLDDSCVKYLLSTDFSEKKDYKKVDIEKIKEMSNNLSKKLQSVKEQRLLKSLKEKDEVKKTLKDTGYLVNDTYFNDSKFKIKKISYYRQPYHKEFPSAKNDQKIFSTLNTLNTSKRFCEMEFQKNSEALCPNEFNILKKKKFCRSAAKIYDSEIVVTDTAYPFKKFSFKIYTDEDIGISGFIQGEMHENVLFL